MELLRLITAGSVDDGKSTLIGRLLYDSNALQKDQLQSLERSSAKRGLSHLDFSLVTDGLKDELEQGITIDIAHRYFNTKTRKYILADTPGHIQYTRNFITAASTANLAIILIDATKGVVEQTRRHSLIASLMGIRHLIFCVNKMDLVDYSITVFENIKQHIEALSAKLDVYDIRYIPVSALHGENIVNKSDKMPWYTFGGLLDTLESIHISSDRNLTDGRFPVQLVLREHNTGYRACAGQVASGIFRAGEEVTVMPAGINTRISKIEMGGKEVEAAETPMSVSISLEDEIDISRGSMLVKRNNKPVLLQEIDILMCLVDIFPVNINASFFVRSTTQETKCIIKDILYKIDISNFSKNTDLSNGLVMNDIARVKLKLAKPLLLDIYKINKMTGSIILIDTKENNTVAAGIILPINI